MRHSIRTRLMVWVLALLVPLSAAGALAAGAGVRQPPAARHRRRAGGGGRDRCRGRWRGPASRRRRAGLRLARCRRSRLGTRKYITVVPRKASSPWRRTERRRVLASVRPSLRVVRYADGGARPGRGGHRRAARDQRCTPAFGSPRFCSPALRCSGPGRCRSVAGHRPRPCSRSKRRRDGSMRWQQTTSRRGFRRPVRTTKWVTWCPCSTACSTGSSAPWPSCAASRRTRRTSCGRR